MNENPKDKFGAEKAPLWLNPPTALVQMAWAIGSGTQHTPDAPAGGGMGGAEGYPPYSWRTAGARASVYLSAAERHMLNFAAGHNYDAKSSCHELAHVMANCAIMLDAIHHGQFTDDRPYSTLATMPLALYKEKL